MMTLQMITALIDSTAMRKSILGSIVFFAAAALTLSSCEKEIKAPVSSEPVKITVKAVADDFANAAETKTYITSDKQVLWGENEQMTIALISPAGESVFAKSTKTSDWDGEAEAYFEFSIDAPEAESYTYGGIYPSSAVLSDNKYAENAKTELRNTQSATADSYDPSAYILVAKPETFTEVQTEWVASYRRATALNKITLKNLADDIVKVEITATGKDLAGRRNIDMTTGESKDIYYGQSETITVNYESALAKDSDKDIWFTSWGAELAENETLTLKAFSANAIYTRTIEAKSSGIKFKEGYLNLLSIDMASAEKETISGGTYANEYIILGLNEGVYYAMQPYVSGNNFKAVEVEYDEPGLVIAPASCKVTVAPVADMLGYYTIQDSKGSYLYAASGSSNQLKGESAVDSNNNAYWYISCDEDVWTVKADKSSNRNVMQFNYNNGSPIFSCYATASQAPVILIPWDHVDAEEDPVLKSWPIVISPSEYGTISATVGGKAVTSGESFVEGSEVTITATPKANYNFSCWRLSSAKPANANASTTTFILNGPETVEAIFEKIQGLGGGKYVKVSSTSDLTDGTYLIVCEDQKVAFNGGLETLDAVSNTVSVTISNGEIASSGSVDAATFTFTVADGSFKSKSGKYIGNASNSNGLTSSDTVLGNTVTISGGDADVVGTGGAYLRYNATSGQTRFRYYKSSTYTAQKAIQLYKYVAE